MTLFLILLIWFGVAFLVALVLGRLIAGPKPGTFTETDRMREERTRQNQQTAVFWEMQRKEFEARQRKVDEQRRRWAA